jgi:hypothetical protein
MPKKVLVLVLGLFSFQIQAQIPVEIFAGKEKAGIDLMFFRLFKGKDGKDSRFLFFNRNRAVADWRHTDSTFLPQFGFTEAFSWQIPGGKGFAPVALVQVLNTGVYPKAGVQWYRQLGQLTLFTWLVTELKSSPLLDGFLLLRYTHPLTENWALYGQGEGLITQSISQSSNRRTLQRIRLGIQFRDYQLGGGLDLSQVAGLPALSTKRPSLFIRHVF